MKQIGDWSRSVTFKRLQKFSGLSLSELEFLISMSIPNIFFYISIYLTSKITIKVSYLHKALLIISLISPKDILIFPANGGLYAQKQTHFSLEVVNSEHCN